MIGSSAQRHRQGTYRSCLAAPVQMHTRACKHTSYSACALSQSVSTGPLVLLKNWKVIQELTGTQRLFQSGPRCQNPHTHTHTQNSQRNKSKRTRFKLVSNERYLCCLLFVSSLLVINSHSPYTTAPSFALQVSLSFLLHTQACM